MSGMNSIRLAVCITFFYKSHRIPYLLRCLRALAQLPGDKHVFIVTNANVGNFSFLPESWEGESNMQVDVCTFPSLGHPLLFPWCHFEVWKNTKLDDYTHFLYLEDDIMFTPANLKYWIEARVLLKRALLIPGFLRVEFGPDKALYSTDICSSMWLPALPSYVASGSKKYVESLYPYQGMYLFDRELMEEFMNSPSFSPNSGVWKIQEKAAQGLTFESPPFPFNTRIVLPVDRSAVDANCFVEHMAATYASKQHSRLGKIPASKVFISFPTLRFLLRLVVVNILDSYLLRNRK